MKTDYFSSITEEKAYTKIVSEYLRDGIGTIDLGISLLCYSVGIFLWPDSWTAQFIVLAILSLTIPLNLYLKKKITFRRLGYARILFHPPSLFKSRVNRYHVMHPILQAFALGFAIFTVMVLARHWGISVYGAIGSSITQHPVADTMCMIGLSASVAGLDVSLGKKYFWIVAAFMLGCVFLTGFFLMSSGWPLLFTGSLMIIFGIQCLRRFLREHPRLEEADAQ